MLLLLKGEAECFLRMSSPWKENITRLTPVIKEDIIIYPR
jgi:hypothetical protein